ncbi:MAG: sigma-70 family RNA polymerase sigma factor, partial [Nibricoccus sp.]
MNLSDATDHELLGQFSREGSQAAFGEIVRRHLDLVYSAARRQVRSSQLAEDVTQSVFVDLSRSAAGFSKSTPVVAWLHLVARRTAIDAVRREVRRQKREQSALEVSTMNTTPADWEHVEPVLDETLAELDDRDRSAVLLRFLENKTLRQVVDALGISDDAAQKRVSRALDQVRTSFLKRGIVLTAAGLAADLSAHGIETAPMMLGATIVGSAS